MADLRFPALGGVVGPVAFVGAWSLAGLSADHYSAVHNAISELAQTGAPTRAAMTAGFVVFGVSLPVYSQALRAALGGPAWITACATGIATLGVAAVPLHPGTRVPLHAVLAGAGYATLAATPLLASLRFARNERRAWARASRIAGFASAVCLVASFAGPAHGLFQRLGLGIGDVWIVATAIEMIRTETLTLSSSSIP